MAIIRKGKLRMSMYEAEGKIKFMHKRGINGI